MGLLLAWFGRESGLFPIDLRGGGWGAGIQDCGTTGLRDYGEGGPEKVWAMGSGRKAAGGLWVGRHVAGEPIDGAAQHVAAVRWIGEAVAFVGVDD